MTPEAPGPVPSGSARLTQPKETPTRDADDPVLLALWVQGQSAFGSEGEAAGPWLKRGHQEGSG